MGGSDGASAGAQVATTMTGEGGGGGGVGKPGSSPSHFVLSGQKMQLLERMKAVR